jgi:hypothetical protein
MTKKIVEIPTKKSAFSQVKKSFEPVVAGAIGGTGVAVGEAILGDVIGPGVGGVAASLFIKDEVEKKIVVTNAVMDMTYRIME